MSERLAWAASAPSWLIWERLSFWTWRSHHLRSQPSQCLGSRFPPEVLSTLRCTQGGYLSYFATLLIDVEELGTTRRQ